MKVISNREIARILTHIAEILSVRGENPFKIRAYTRASQNIERLTYPLSSLKDWDELSKIPGIGEGLSKKITELLTTGKLSFYEELKKSEAALVTEFLKIPGIGPKHAKIIYDQLDIKTVEALEKAAQEGKLRALSGLGEKVEQKILQGIRQIRKHKDRRPLVLVYPQAQAILKAIKKVKEVQQIILAGSLRRMKETIGDVDILVASDDPEEVIQAFVNLPVTVQVLAKGKTRSSIVTENGIQVDLRVVEQRSFGAAAHYFTGSKAHNIRIRSMAAQRGLKINEYGVFRKDKIIAGGTEEEVFRSVDLPFIPPELREDQGEIEAAQKGALPKLIELEDIKGDLHIHSNWSDGIHSIEEMALAAQKKGYEYIAVCDHSSAVRIANGLSEDRLCRQMEVIERLNRKFKGFRILKGIEVDIRSDGCLDFSDQILEKLDIFVAAVHSGFNLPEDKITQRIIKAIENPHVDVIAHPTGRLIGKREPYPLDMEKIMDACRKNRKMLELNAHPERLDLSDVHCRKAKDKKVKLAISSDAHSIDHLEWVNFGISTAKRGWIEASNVVNTFSLSKRLRFF